MQESSNLKKNAVTGSASLGVVGFLTKFVGVGGGVLLARWLSPEDFGIFVIVGFLIGVIKLANDFGLAVSLIQRDEEPDPKAVSSLFFFQMALTLALVLLMFLLVPLVPSVYPAFQDSYRWILYALLGELVVESMKSVPKSLLARAIQYQKISKVELFENLVYWGVVLAFAYQGQGVWALALAVVCRTVFGTVYFYSITRWYPQWCFSFSLVRKYLRFGFEYQLLRIADFARSAIAPTVISSFFGATGLGLVSWAMQTSRTPYFIINAFDRVGFPLYSRFQSTKDEVVKNILKFTEATLILILPMMAGLVLFSSEIIHFIFTDKWMGAETMLRLFAGQFALLAASYPLSTSLFALGHTRYLLVLVILLFSLELLLTLILKSHLGVDSIAYAMLISSFLNLSLLFLAFRWFCGRWVNIFFPLVKALLMNALVFGLVWYFKNSFAATSWLLFSLNIALYLFLHSLGLWIFYRQSVAQAVRLVRSR